VGGVNNCTSARRNFLAWSHTGIDE